MYKQKLTLDPKLSEVCEATLTVYDPEPLNEEAATEAVNFTVVGSGVISAEEKAVHQKMRAVAPLAAGEKDVAITSLECVSIDGDVLPAQFQMYYEFHVANYSDEAIASVPVTIYFNTPNSDLVAQGTTTVSNIPAGHYQALQFAFPGVVAGTWMMSMEANQPRAFEESDYTNNLLSKTFTYVNKAELVAEEVSAITDDPAYDSSGRPIIYYDVPTTLDFCVSNISAISASNVLLQVPAAFQDSTGAYSTMLTEGKIDMPANTRRHAQLNITFTKPATAQIGVVLNSDRACNEVSYDNNEASQVFTINKYNPSTGPDPDDATDVDFSDPDYVAEIPGRMAMPLFLQNQEDTWDGLQKGNISNFIFSGCGVCSLAMIISYMNGTLMTAVDVANSSLANPDGSVASWDISSKCPGYNLSAENTISTLTDNTLQVFINQIVVAKRPVLYRVNGSSGMHFVVISGYEFDPKKVGTSGYASDPYDLSHFKVMDPYDNEQTEEIEGRCQTLADVHQQGHYEIPLYYKLVVDAN